MSVYKYYPLSIVGKIVQLHDWMSFGKTTIRQERQDKVKLFLPFSWPNYRPPVTASATHYLWSPTCFKIPELFSTLLFFGKYSSLFCSLSCSPPGTLLVVGVERGLFFLCFGLVKRIKITPARLSFTTAARTRFNKAVQDSKSWKSRQSEE